MAPLRFLDASAAYPFFLIAATLAVLLFIGVRPQALRVSRSLTVATAILYAVGAAASCWCLFAPATQTALAASGAADLIYFGGLIGAGLGFGVLMIAWGSFYVDIPLRNTWIIILAVAFAQPLIMALLSLAPLLWVVLPCMPLISLGCLRTSLGHLSAFGHEGPRLEPRSISIRPAYVIGIASISFCFGVLKFLGLTTGVVLSTPEGLIVDLFTAAALIILFRCGERGYSLAWRVIGFIMLIGLALLLVLQQNLLSSAFTVVAIGYGIFEYALWIATVDLAKYAQSAPLRFLGLTFAFTIGGQGAGALATLAVPPSFATTPLILVALAITAAAIIWLLPAEAVQTLFAPAPPLHRGSSATDATGLPAQAASKDAEAPNDSAREQVPSEREVRMALLRESCGLTNREAEIALLLAGGRSARFIQGELVISEGTTWTHIRHIYQKLGVSSRQEFLTAIEEVLT
ncbi:helix-turn-helix transcriptional regulator [Adlercreutzia equolifaciens]|uniref:response regulator transcription factor n=1 Tax=Adlercreutzia equolifaciens TaxID=446660 RepID=UPI0023B13B6C|nr:helix-turn-helix transcriptional regulator [Adlercreutzia equolifaciens]MDE8701896.1 helix-turn-helix transcriptional regulator [Adlercreutzia equolifaciens]